jgi:DNA-binding HxlR family transcriptional regulator
MAATVRYDEQFCPIARALDVLGDRWTLLILRELVSGDQRFTDLRTHLPGIASTLLTQRLRTMTDQGLVTVTDPEPGSARSRYAVTDRGRDAIPVLSALVKFGMPLLEEPADDQVVRPWAAVNAAIGAFHDPVEAVDVDERYLFRLDGEDVFLSTVRGRSRRGGVASAAKPDLVVTSSARVWFDIRQGRLTVADAIDQGLVQVAGPKRALKNLQRIFHLP